MDKYLAETKMLDFNSVEIANLIVTRKWNQLDDFNKIKSIYEFVQNEILFGFNADDILSASEVLADGIGQCNTKATLLMALLRGAGIPCRIHAFEVDKDFQKGVTSGLVSILAPKRIVHTWVEVYYNEWYALEGVITDKKYLSAIQEKYSEISSQFYGYAIATRNLAHPQIDWNKNDTFIQKEAIVSDYGIFSSPDEFFKEHHQHFSKLKQVLYAKIGSRLMTRNVSKIRAGKKYKRK